MSQSEIKRIQGRAVVVAGNDIDTDQIIPARYLRCITFDNLAEGLFYDARFDAAGQSKGHALDSEAGRAARILISDEHFGCGSSREHAPQAIQKAGFDAIIAGSYAEIFFGNATALGIPCFTIACEDRDALKAALKEHPEAELEILLEEKILRVPALGLSFSLDIKEAARSALMDGSFDPLSQLLGAKELVAVKSASLAY